MVKEQRSKSNAEPSADAARLKGYLALVREVAVALARPVDAAMLFRALYDRVSRPLDAPIALLGLYDEVNERVEVVGQVDSGVELPHGPWSFPLGSGFTSQVIRTRQPRLIRRWATEGPRIQVLYGSEQDQLKQPQAGLIVPLMAGEQVVGVLSLQSYVPEAYDEMDLLMLEAVGGVVASALERLRESPDLDDARTRRVAELEAILASMVDALLLVDADGCVVRINHEARQLLQLEMHALVVGQPLDRERWGRWQPGARAIAEALEPMIAAALSGPAFRDREVEILGGALRVLSFSGSPMRHPDGTAAGAAIIFRDVTGLREVERLKDEMLSMASHDLKTPVSTIKMQAQLLQRRIASGRSSSEANARGAALIVQEADRLVRLLNLLLDLSRVEAGRLDLERTDVDLVRLAESLVASVGATTTRHQISVRGPERMVGRWDAQRLEQVLQNLLTNAVKYSPDGGEVTVDLAEEEHGVSVCVTDQGVGLTAEEIEHVFDRFYRAEKTRRLEGTGLGLYICQGIVSGHGGRLWVESAGTGLGSTFCFSLPRDTAGPAVIA